MNIISEGVLKKTFLIKAISFDGGSISLLYVKRALSPIKCNDFILSRGQIINLINQGHSVKTLDKHGDQAEVIICGDQYLTTSPTDVTCDNLGELPLINEILSLPQQSEFKTNTRIFLGC